MEMSIIFCHHKMLENGVELLTVQYKHIEVNIFGVCSNYLKTNKVAQQTNVA